MATTQPIRRKRDIKRLAAYWLRRGNQRNYAMIILAVHTALRISDLLRLRWDDVYDFERNCVRESIELTEGKTGKGKRIALNAKVVKALALFAVEAARRGHFLIRNPKTGKAISRIQAYRVIREAAQAIKLPSRASCHSLRKSFGYHAWKSGVSPAVIMEIYNHSSLAVTRRYLGVTQDDKDKVYLALILTA